MFLSPHGYDWNPMQPCHWEPAFVCDILSIMWVLIKVYTHSYRNAIRDVSGFIYIFLIATYCKNQ